MSKDFELNEGPVRGRRRLTLRAASELVDRWRLQVPIGTQVIVTKDDGSRVPTKTRSAAQLSASNDAVIFLEGIAGYYALERVELARMGKRFPDLTAAQWRALRSVQARGYPHGRAADSGRIATFLEACKLIEKNTDPTFVNDQSAMRRYSLTPDGWSAFQSGRLTITSEVLVMFGGRADG